MCAYKTYQHEMHSKLHYGYKPEIIPLYIKHIMLISHIVNTIKRPAHIVEVFPLSRFNLLAPILQSGPRSRMSLVI